jgi:hypothetical protein
MFDRNNECIIGVFLEFFSTVRRDKFDGLLKIDFFLFVPGICGIPEIVIGEKFLKKFIENGEIILRDAKNDLS